MSCCDICDELAQIKAEQAWEREALTLLLQHAGLQVPGTPPAGGNYWNPADKAATVTLTNGDKTASGDYGSVRSVTSHGSGKYYLEMVATGNLDDSCLGFANGTFTITGFLGYDADSVGLYGLNGNIAIGGGDTPYGAPVLDGDVVGFAIDIDNELLYVNQGGTWQNSADPVAGTGGFSFSTLSGPYFAAASIQSGGKEGTIRTQDSEFTGTPPTGYTAWG